MYMTLSSRLANKLRSLRGESSQTSFAKKLGITQASLNRIENCGQNVTLKTLELFMKRLKCDIADLFKE